MNNQHAEDNVTKYLLTRFRLSSILVLMCNLSLLLALSGQRTPVNLKSEISDLRFTGVLYG